MSLFGIEQRRVIWSRYTIPGYEVSSQGDKRFSALFAVMPDGRTIEMHYQCDVKGYEPGGTNWRLGKGKPSLRPVNLYVEYLALWTQWAANNQALMQELRIKTAMHNFCLTDVYARSNVNQARALADLLNRS